MSNRPAVATRPLTRQKLAAVLGERPEQLRAFEAMLDDVSGVLPDAVQVAADAAEAAQLAAAAAVAAAAAATAAAAALDLRVDVLEALPPGHVIEDEGVPLAQRSAINFTGSGVTVTDAGGKTVVDVGSSGGNAVAAVCDFGGTFGDKAQAVVIGQAWVTPTSKIVAQVLTPAGVDPDEMRLLDLRPVVSDLVAGVGFTLTLYSEPEAAGSYSVMCMGV